jgi:hypothetical protein
MAYLQTALGGLAAGPIGALEMSIGDPAALWSEAGLFFFF